MDSARHATKRFKATPGSARHGGSSDRRRSAAQLAVAAAAALYLFVLPPTAAHAAPYPPRLDFAYRLAGGYWAEKPRACASVDRQIVPPGSLGNPLVGAISGMSNQVPADAPPGSVNCFLWIDRAYAEPIIFDLLCAVMVHHYGHLLGMEHSPDPRNAMHERIPVPEVCKAKGRQSARLHLLRLKFRWLQAQKGPRKSRARRKAGRELRREARRFWSTPRRLARAARAGG